MISIVALCLRTDIHRVVAAALRRQRAQTLRCKELACTYVKNALLLCRSKRRVVESYCKYHIRTHTPVGAVQRLYIVEQITILIDECIEERVAAQVGTLLVFSSFVLSLKFGCHRSAELQSVIPQSVKLNDIACTRNYWTAIGCRVHPCNGFLLAFAVKQSVVHKTQVRMLVGNDISYNIL